MALSEYQASVSVFIRGLGVLDNLLAKAATHVTERELDPAVLIHARLAPDMLDLAGQVQRASDTSKLSVERLSGVLSPRFEDNEATFADLHARIAATRTYLQGIQPAQLEHAGERTVTLNFGAFKPSFQGHDYLLTFALPNFFFHVTTAHDILRHAGVVIGKRDYLGPYDGAAQPIA